MNPLDPAVWRRMERLVDEEMAADDRACARAGVDPRTHTRCPRCVRLRGERYGDCTSCGGSGVILLPF